MLLPLYWSRVRTDRTLGLLTCNRINFLTHRRSKLQKNLQVLPL
jgi:hypothetical protein